MGFWSNLFASKKTGLTYEQAVAQLPDGFVPDAGIYFYLPRLSETGHTINDEIVSVSMGREAPEFGESTVGNMLVYNMSQDGREYCLSVITDQSLDAVAREVLSGTFTVRGRLSKKELTDGNGIQYRPIFGTVQSGAGN